MAKRKRKRTMRSSGIVSHLKYDTWRLTNFRDIRVFMRTPDVNKFVPHPLTCGVWNKCNLGALMRDYPYEIYIVVCKYCLAYYLRYSSFRNTVRFLNFHHLIGPEVILWNWRKTDLELNWDSTSSVKELLIYGINWMRTQSVLLHWTALNLETFLETFFSLWC